MGDLLEQVLRAHGGVAHWRSFKKVSATIVTGGEFWASKGIEIDETARCASAAIHSEWTTVAPYGNPDYRMTFSPERVVVETTGNEIVAQRRDPKAAFVGHTLTTPWDPLHRGYFNGYALWIYLTSPFVLAFPGVDVEETESWQEGDETWRALRATFTEGIATHSREQEFYFGPDFLLRRHDYQVDISGGFLAAHYVGEIKEFDGFEFPMKRRAHPRDASRQPDRSRTLVSIDLSEFKLS